MMMMMIMIMMTRYIGTWSRDKMDGKGVYQYRNGDR